MAKMKTAKAAVEPVELEEFAIEIENIGPVERASIPLRPGHVTVLTGSNGAGKSETLAAVTALAVGGTSLEARDGTEGGSVSGLGITIKVGRKGQNRRTGELEVLAVEDGFDLSKFVDPGLKDPVAADKQRIKTLATLLGVKVTVEAVKGLIGSGDLYEQNVTDKTAKLAAVSAVSAVDFVDGVKRDLEFGAREIETEAARAEQDAVTLEGTLAGVDLTAESDGDVLTKRWTEAAQNSARLREQGRLAVEAARIAEDARAVVESGEVVTVEQRQNAFEEYHAKWSEARIRLIAAEKAQDEALATERGCRRDLEELERLLKDANVRRERLDAAKAKLVPSVVPPTEAELDAASVAEIAAETAVIAGAKIRDGKATMERATRARIKASSLGCDAVVIRDAAAKVVWLLAGPINAVGCGVQITNDGRLVVQGHRRGQCFMSDLSPGERWSICMKLAASVFKSAGVPALLAVPQEAFESLDSWNRKIFHDAVAESGMMVVTALASQDLESAYCPVAATVLE